MKYKIHVTTDQGKLLNTAEVDTDEPYWDSYPDKCETVNEIYNEIYKDLERSKDDR